MRCTLHFSTAVLAIVLEVPCAAQSVSDGTTPLQQAREAITALRQGAELRRHEVTRHSKLLADLTDVADEVSTFSSSSSLDRARRKLEEVTRAALAEPSVPEPGRSTLERVRVTLSRPGADFDASRTRAEVFRDLSQLEEHIIRLSESCLTEATSLESLAHALQSTVSGLRASTYVGVRMLVETRKDALK